MAAVQGSIDRPPGETVQVLLADTGTSDLDGSMPCASPVSAQDARRYGPSHDGEVKDADAGAALGDGLPRPELPAAGDSSASAADARLTDSANPADISSADAPTAAAQGLGDSETETAANDSTGEPQGKSGSAVAVAAAAAVVTATPSGNVSDAGDSTSDNSSRRMPRMITSGLAVDGGDAGGSASPGGGSGSAARAAADLAKAKEREEQVRLRREIINREKQKKIDELLEAQRLAQEYRRQQEELRRQKIEEMKRKDEERQKHAVDRRQARDREDEERRNQLQQRKLERHQRLEEELASARRRSGRRSEAFGFGSSSPRFDDSLAAAAAIAAGKRSSSISNVFSSGHRGPSSSGGDSSDGGGGGENYVCPRFRDYHRRCLSAHAALHSSRRSRGDTLTATPRGRAGERRPPDSPTSDGPSSRWPASGGSAAAAAARQSRSVERRRRTAVGASASATSRGRVPAASRAKSAPARGPKSAASDNQSSPRGRVAVALSSSSSDGKSPRAATKPRPAWVGGPADDGVATDEQLPVPSGNAVRVLRSPPPDAHCAAGDTPKVTISEKTLERLATPKVAKAAADAAAPAASAAGKGVAGGITSQTLERLATPKHSRADGDGGKDEAAKDATKPAAGHGISPKTLERLATPKRPSAADDGADAEGGSAARPSTAAAGAGAGAISVKTLERLAAPKRATADSGDEAKNGAGASTPTATAERPLRKKTRAPAPPQPKQAGKPDTAAVTPDAKEDDGKEDDGEASAAAAVAAGARNEEDDGMPKESPTAVEAAAAAASDGVEPKPADVTSDERSPSPQAASGDSAASATVAAAAAGSAEPAAAAKRQSRPIKRATPSSAAPKGHVTVSEQSTPADKRGDGKSGETHEKQAPRRRPLSAKRAPKTAAHEGDDSESPDEPPKAKVAPRMPMHAGMRKAKSVASVAMKLSPEPHAKADTAREREAAAKPSAARLITVSSAASIAPHKSKFPKSKSHDALKAAAAAGSSGAVRGAGTAAPATSGGEPAKEEPSTGAEDDGAEAAVAAAHEQPVAGAQHEASPAGVAQDEAPGGGAHTPPEERAPAASETPRPLPADGGSDAGGGTDSAKAPMDAYKMKLAERRRQAREKADKEAEEERRRQEEQRLAEEEAERRLAEEERRQQDEERRQAEEAAHAEEERLRLAIEETEKRRKEQADAAEAERVAKEEADKKLKEEAEKREKALREKIEREEAERLERKKKLESIMKRVKTEPASQEMKKNDSSSSLTSMTDSFILGGTIGSGGKTVSTPVATAAAQGKDSEDASSKFRSPLLNSLIAGRSKSEAAMKTAVALDDSGSSIGSGDQKAESHSLTGSTNGLNGACHDGEPKVAIGNGGQSDDAAAVILTGREQFVKTGAATSSTFGSLFGNNNVIEIHQSSSSDGSDVGGLEGLTLVSAGSSSSTTPAALELPIEGAH